MNTTRRGKIARLPRGIREQLNRRLDDGAEEETLAAWLNEMPEVQAMLAAEFEGKPINQPNISKWKTGGGFEDWKAQEQALARVDRIMEDAEEIEGTKAGLLGDRLAVWVVSRLILAAGTVGKENEKDWKLLRELSRIVAELRRGDRGAGWLRIEEKRLEGETKEQERKLEEEFWKWAEKPEIREAICQGFLSHEEKLAMMHKAMFGELEEKMRRGPRRPIPGEAPAPEGGEPGQAV